ncbi:uncharacterized protein LOC110818165 [Carica papaya]|uniref:uncharacterized protein LOC110818165 n=1 Tax=Carica papaya TaxID=3649 RepID=UPI000B8CB6CA|nr:uncharacterized protein LOC110818165 [Carica papaya]
MESISVQSGVAEQSMSPYKQMKNPKRNARAFTAKPSENLAPTNVIHGGSSGGVFFPPPFSLSFSYPPSPFKPLYNQIQQPPLLPLPVVHGHTQQSPKDLRRGISCPPTIRKTSTPKKSKEPSKKIKETWKQKESTATHAVPESFPLGPDPNDLPKLLTPLAAAAAGGSERKEVDEFSGSLFTVSPPPSSLPLPRFSMRSKLSCNAEAAGIDAGATDNLRRLLRLR